MSIILRNPHSVIAALEARPQDVLKVVLPSQGASDVWQKVGRLAREKSIPVVSQSKSQISSKGPTGRSFKSEKSDRGESLREGMSEAHVREKASLSAEEIFKNARDRSGGSGLWLALDCLQDPQNVGAIFRAAAFFGVQGIIMTQERSAPLSGVVYDVACGGVEAIPFVIQANLQRAFEVAKEAGLWILGTSEHAKDSIKTIQRDRPWLLVLGSEENGMRRLTQEACDLVCQIPPKGRVTSLNVSVAAGILISHLA